MATTEQQNTGTQSTRVQRYGFDPIFPVTDMQRSIQHYTSLGFSVEISDADAGYAFATLPDHGTIHLSLQSEASHDPKVSAAAAYLYVADADALANGWRTNCPAGDTRDPFDTDYGLREGAHLDPDNNLIRFGSRMAGSK